MLVIVPTRSRPDNVARQIDAINKTRCFAEIVYVCDNNDPAISDYNKVFGRYEYQWVKPRLEKDQMMLGPKLNKYAIEYSESNGMIGFMGDDHMPRTPIWDGLIAAELRNTKAGMVYPNDLFQRENLPTSVFMRSSIIDTLGYMIPPEIDHLYCDNFWLEIGRVLGIIKYREDIVIEHMHPHAKKAEEDEQYSRVNSNEQYEKDKAGFEKYKKERFSADIKALMEVMK